MIESDITKLNFAITQGNPVVGYFTSPSCGPCKTFSPLLKEISQDFPEIEIHKVELTSDLARQINIRSVPALAYYSKGRKITHQTGIQPKQVLKDNFRELLNVDK